MLAALSLRNTAILAEPCLLGVRRRYNGQRMLQRIKPPARVRVYCRWAIGDMRRSEAIRDRGSHGGQEEEQCVPVPVSGAHCTGL